MSPGPGTGPGTGPGIGRGTGPGIGTVATARRREIERVGASIAFSATSLVVVATLAAALDPARYAAVGLVYVTSSVLTNLVRYGLFDATLAGLVPVAACRVVANRLAGGAVVATAAAAALALVLWLDPLASAVVAGAGLAVAADLARMVRLCDRRAGVVLRADLAWLAITVGFGVLTWVTGTGPAVGVVGGWVIGGAGWTVVALRDVGEPGLRPRWRRVLTGTGPLAVSGTGPFLGYLLGMAAVTAVGRPTAAAVMEIGRLVGMPAITIYSGLRLEVVAESGGPGPGPAGGSPVDGPSVGGGPGRGSGRPLAAVVALAVSTAAVCVTLAVALTVPAGEGSALDAARRWWPLLAVAQVARLVLGVVSDTARPLLGPGSGLRLGVASMVLGALVPPALVAVLGDAGGPLSQLAVVGLIWALITAALRASPVAHRRSPHVRALR